ncbi:hypothetical protein AURMO_01509 [Aurantimicrobium photophilum]|uniref:Uncharacterized protein n=1 Tax=Aurantimicrobium photophilum TaxID=1987356 RepID=A0A2Z3RZ81_9MICO|nr:hypothetical protein AURMO_01509 [Aurantimicrobium photophilum]
MGDIANGVNNEFTLDNPDALVQRLFGVISIDGHSLAR